MKKCIFYIQDNQYFCIGNKDKVLDYFSSDRLYSAIINIANLIYEKDDLKELIDNINRNICFSSMFMGLEIQNTKTNMCQKVFFVKKPYMRIAKGERTEKDLDLRKRIKKLNYVSEEVLKDLLKNYDRENDKLNYDLNEHIILNNRFVIHKNEFKCFENLDLEKLKDIKFITNILRPKVSLQRHNLKSDNVYFEQLLQVKYVRINDYIIKPFMYFYIDGTFDERLRPVFALMCDEGIGGERAFGAGKFINYEIIDVEDFTKEGELFVSLSVVYPKKEEANYIYSYMLEDRKGYVYTNRGTSIKKPYIRVIAEGSIFSAKIEGLIKEYRFSNLEHPIYTYGKAFLVGFGGGD